MAVSPDLTGALKKVVIDLENDLRERVESQPDVLADWRKQHSAAAAKERTGMSWQQWRDDRVTMAAVAWVLTTVFIRFCEDNRLLKPVWIAGPDNRRQEALDAELAYFRKNPEDTDREWLLQAVEHLRTTKATLELVESHSSLWTVSPSGQAAKRLINFWRAKTESGELVWDFTDPELSTRFLGDLYQDLSDYAKKTYALLQTPVFVEEFILDQSMEPALKERPLEGFKIIDPTCGSGHFLLGAFARLDARWANRAPDLETRARVSEVLKAIHGVDLNPFAVAIAKFRLMVAALQACGERSLEEAPNFHFNLAAGDSLLHWSYESELPIEDFDADSQISGFAYDTEDLDALRTILAPGQYDVVVGNPPYIPVEDRKLRTTYRKLYPTCKGTYALTVPFMERFFQLAKPSSGDRPAGWMGQITSNSFMKREFGSKLIEEFLVRMDLRLVVDSAGAYIPGHGTPTVILIGRPQAPTESTVKAVLGVRGEPAQPAIPENGLVWSSIADNIRSDAYLNEFINITQLDRTALKGHPWSLAGGGTGDLLSAINAKAVTVGKKAIRIGFFGDSHADEAFFLPKHVMRRFGVSNDLQEATARGDGVRDWRAEFAEAALLPRTLTGKPSTQDALGRAIRLYWPLRTELWSRGTFGGETYRSSGRDWLDWHQLPLDRLANRWAIAFAEVATHNHFVLDRDGRVFNRSAPVIKLPKEAKEDDHVALLALLNSSSVLFWLRQVCGGKGGSGIGRGIQPEAWMERFNYNSTNVADIPVGSTLPLARGKKLDALAHYVAQHSPQGVIAAGVPTVATLAEASQRWESLRGQMVAQQEELDWEVYHEAYGLIDETMIYCGDDLPEIRLGERAFEISLARRVASGKAETAWFKRHGSTLTTEIPSQWPPTYQNLIQRRIDLIESDKFIQLLERPEYKRRWASESWESQLERVLGHWLLDRMEDQKFWFDAQQRPAARSVAQLADMVSRDADLVSMLDLWSGRRDQSVTQQLAALLDGESVPFLAAHRLKVSGLRKREAWEQTWELQRREDAGERIDDIPVPPKYTSADFRKTAWWQHRGKLDVPKERFILYPDAGRETDPTELLGWAGWDHAQQALALAMVIGEREQEGWSEERLEPLVAGLAELQPWVRQWHDEVDDTYGLNLADFCEEQLRDRALQVHKTLDELKKWQPKPATRRRKAKV
ncbi:BREX-2 system adenine-specific DNA-methyltransferase PglX [Kribbella sp. NPDC050470]|uniref:BREX-2 system adenine-specific DNA-methyltransferase PglX n=1 Tax=Kribbella sp. NPDC050470 TaxID=3364117 RepID=UPI0037915AF0